MYENEIIEVINGRVNKNLKQWHETKVKEIALFLKEELKYQAIQKLELEKNICNPAPEIIEEVLIK